VKIWAKEADALKHSVVILQDKCQTNTVGNTNQELSTHHVITEYRYTHRCLTVLINNN